MNVMRGKFQADRELLEAQSVHDDITSCGVRDV